MELEEEKNYIVIKAKSASTHRRQRQALITQLITQFCFGLQPSLTPLIAMTILREDAEDLERLGDKEVNRVVEEFEARLKILKENHTKELEVVKTTLRDDHKKELEVVRNEVKKALEAEHLKKFTAVSKQIETLQRAEVENLRVQMTEERERIVRDIKESHRLELQELERKYCEQPGSAREITPEVARALREDLSCLEAERNHLKSMQVSDYDSDSLDHP